MFDPNKAKREPVGKWDSDEQLPRDMSYKQAAKAVTRRITQLKWAVRFAVAAFAFAAGMGAHSQFGFLVSLVLSAVLAVLALAFFASANIWAKRAKQHLAHTNDSIKVVEPEEEKPRAKKEAQKSEPVALSN